MKNRISVRDWDEAHLIDAAFDAHQDEPTFGCRLLFDELAAAGFTTSERRGVAVVLPARIVECVREEGGKPCKAGLPAHDDIVRRTFTATAANVRWLTDITEHKTREGNVYLWSIKDMCTNRIVGYSIDSRMNARLAIDVLEMAVTRRGTRTV